MSRKVAVSNPRKVSLQIHRALSLVSPVVEVDDGFELFFEAKSKEVNAYQSAWRKDVNAAIFEVYGISPREFEFYLEIDARVVPQLKGKLHLSRQERDYVERFAAEKLRHKVTNEKSKLEPTVEQLASSLKRASAVFNLVGLSIQRFQELNALHIYILCAELIVRSLAPGTMQNRLNALKQAFCAVGKEKVWTDFQACYTAFFGTWPGHGRTCVAQYDHSLEAAGLTIEEILAKVRPGKQWVAKIIELSWTFGTRIGESTRLRVLRNWHGNRLHIDVEAMPKGRRERDIYVTNERQVAFIAELTDWLIARGDREEIFPSDLSSTQAISQVRYYFLRAVEDAFNEKYSADQLQAMFANRPPVRFHDLRHDFIRRLCEQLGLEVPVAKIESNLDIVAFEKAALFVMLQVGHAAPAKTQAYVGKLPRRPKGGFVKYVDRDLSIWGHAPLFKEIQSWGCLSGGADEA